MKTIQFFFWLEADKAHGKNTLATVISRRAANWELGVLIYGAFVLTGLLVLLGYAPWPVLLTLLSVRLAIPVVRIVFQTDELQDTVEQCAKLHLEYGVLLIIGMLISRFLG